MEIYDFFTLLCLIRLGDEMVRRYGMVSKEDMKQRDYFVREVKESNGLYCTVCHVPIFVFNYLNS